ncbi:hypothetical protein SCANM63S_00462 [Streptomyces canarius]
MGRVGAVGGAGRAPWLRTDATVTECSGKDPDEYFRILHPWSFTPTAPSDVETAMQRLRPALPKQGWKIVRYGPDTSADKNVVLIADNDEERAGVHIARMRKRNPPKLGLTVVSGCYRVPGGQEVEHFQPPAPVHARRASTNPRGRVSSAAGSRRTVATRSRPAPVRASATCSGVRQ